MRSISYITQGSLQMVNHYVHLTFLLLTRTAFC